MVSLHSNGTITKTVTEEDFEPLILQPSPPKHWDCTWDPPQVCLPLNSHLFQEAGPRVSQTLGCREGGALGVRFCSPHFVCLWSGDHCVHSALSDKGYRHNKTDDAHMNSQSPCSTQSMHRFTPDRFSTVMGCVCGGEGSRHGLWPLTSELSVVNMHWQWKNCISPLLSCWVYQPHLRADSMPGVTSQHNDLNCILVTFSF